MSSFFHSEFWVAFHDIFFPKRCLACDKGLSEGQVVSFCRPCRQNIRLIREPYCTVCGKPFEKSAGKSHLCSYCINHTWHFARARGVLCYQGPIAAAVKLFKYSSKMYGLETFTVLIREYRWDHPIPEPDLILPVPLHPKRLRQRGFNQALVLSRNFFPEYKKIIDPFVLERHQSTQPQTGLSAAARRRNVRNAFRVKNPGKVHNKKILLVDDVFTTGATVNECARVLKKNKASKIEVFTFARVVDR